MKFWEAVSAFRGFERELAEVFGSERWRAAYGESFARISELVRTQDRGILDSQLPVELTREIATRCTALQFSFSPKNRCLYPGPAAARGAITMSALEVHDRFGGSVIEEALERGCANVNEPAV